MRTSLGLWVSRSLVETRFEWWNLVAVDADTSIKYAKGPAGVS
jgi:hypothetical protein